MEAAFSFDRESHTFTVGGVIKPSVTQVLSWDGVCDFSFVDEEIRVYSMRRGKSVHWLLQLEDERLLNYRKVPRALLGYRRAYRTWKHASGFAPLEIEKKFVSPFGFAGIVDRVGLLPATCQHHAKTLAIVDFKTGAVCDWVKFQLAAYAAGTQPNISLARMTRRIGLSLFADGTYKVKEFPSAEFDGDIAYFMDALRRMNGNHD